MSFTFNNVGQYAISLPAEAPQDPFLPVEIPSGPAFLDTAACLCAYRETPVSTSHDAMWECIGDQKDRITSTKQGKWFRPVHNDTIINPHLPIWDASNGPGLEQPLMYDDTVNALLPFDSGRLTVYNGACTGQNQTTFSTAFYRSVGEIAAGETPIDAMPCWRGPTAIPMQIMGLDQWQTSGCNAGFLCENNTVNSLPQYCPPVEQCLDGRNAGFVCQIRHINVGMGPFEPVVCQSGWYCPPGGTQKVVCPKGHFCQAGAVRPTPCSLGSSCPTGSKSQASFIPLAVLCTLDLCLVLAMLLFPLRRRVKKRTTAAGVFKGLDKFSQRSSSATVVGGPPASYASTIDVEGTLYGDARQDDGLSPHLGTFVESMKRATEAAHFGLSFKYTNLGYQPPGASTPILHDVTGSIERGNLTAVMGGSGAGKSTFINVLMGKLTNTSGTVMVNNVPDKMERYRKLVGYVPQDDIVIPELTIRENILHSARVRLRRSWTDDEVQAHVDTVIDCLELSHVQHHQIGTVGKPFISGGQRKRASIGMELAAAPMAIFLDEPTSGLDATAASSIMRTLRSTARLGVAVIVTIHQPRAEIMAMVDELILLADGQILCHGPESFVQEHFYKLGFEIPLHANSGDVLTDIITGNGRQYKAEGDVSTLWLVANSTRLRSDPENRESSTPQTSPGPITNRLRSLPASLPALISRASPQQTLTDPAILTAIQTRGASRLTQTRLCLQRAMLQQARYKTSFWSEMFLACIPALLLGLSVQSRNGTLFRGLYKGPFAILSPAVDIGSAPQLSMLTGVAMGLIASAPGVRVFSEEILLQRREAAAGHSQGAYFAAKVLSTLPRILYACLHFSVVLLLLARLVVPWGLAFAANLAYFWCIYGVAAVVAMLARREDAPLLATMVSLILGILCGAAPNLAQVAKWKLVWLWRMSPGVWLTELYFGEMVRPYDYLYQTDLAAEAMGLDLNATARNIGVLLALGVAYRVMAYAGLLHARSLRV